MLSSCVRMLGHVVPVKSLLMQNVIKHSMNVILHFLDRELLFLGTCGKNSGDSESLRDQSDSAPASRLDCPQLNMW